MPPLAPLPPPHPASSMIDPPSPEDSFYAHLDQFPDYIPPTSFDASVDSIAPSSDGIDHPPAERRSIEKTGSPPLLHPEISESLSSFSEISSTPSSFPGSPPPLLLDLPTLSSMIDSGAGAFILERTNSASAASLNGSRSSGSFKSSRTPVTFLPPEESTSVGGQAAVELLPMDELRSLEEHSLYMHLQRAVTFVLSLKEAMWEELVERIKKEDLSLLSYGWTQSDFNEEIGRVKFEQMVEQFKRYVNLTSYVSA